MQSCQHWSTPYVQAPGNLDGVLVGMGGGSGVKLEGLGGGLDGAGPSGRGLDDMLTLRSSCDACSAASRLGELSRNWKGVRSRLPCPLSALEGSPLPEAPLRKKLPVTQKQLVGAGPIRTPGMAGPDVTNYLAEESWLVSTWFRLIRSEVGCKGERPASTRSDMSHCWPVPNNLTAEFRQM